MNAFSAGFGWMGSMMLERVVNFRNRGFDKGKRVHDVGVPVISIGNITVGGTGKTPMVRWVVRALQDMGKSPAIALRGYKAHQGRSDEAIEHEQALPGVPVLVGPKRVQTITSAIRSGVDLDSVVLDDGFQHRFVQRALDIVLVDARRPPDTDRLLPAGRLREPARCLRRADAVVVTHADHASSTLVERMTELHGAAPVASCVHTWSGLRRVTADSDTNTDVEALDGLRVVTRLAIAGPEGIQHMLQAHGSTVIADLPARDHQAATPRDVDRLADLAAGADAIVVSAKDMATLEPLLETRPLPVPVLVPQLALRFLDGEAALRSLVGSVFNSEGD